MLSAAGASFCSDLRNELYQHAYIIGKRMDGSSGTFGKEADKTPMMSPRDYLKTRYSLGNEKVVNKDEEEGEEKEEGEEEGNSSSPFKKNSEAEISLLCSDGRVRVVSPSAVLKVLRSHPQIDAEELRARVQARCLKGPQPKYEEVDQFFLDAVKEVCNG